MKGMHFLTILAFAGAMSAVAMAAQGQAAKPMPPDVGNGRVAWFDITSSDVAAAKTFYGALFDWTFTPVMGDVGYEIVSGNLAIGTLRVADGAIAPFNGVVYIQVDDVAAACKKAASLGATIAPGFPFDLPDGRGAIGLALDPTGHPFGMYARKPLGRA